MFRRPREDSDDDVDDFSGRVVKAKPINQKYAQKLGITGKDFVQGSKKSQTDFYGKQTVEQTPSGSGSSGAPLTEDERNKISAKILKAELKGDKELVKKLKRKLEADGDVDEPKEKHVVLMKSDRSGNLIPSTSRDMKTDKFAAGSSSRMQREYAKDQDLVDMVREEKTGTAEDQLRLFERSLVKSAKIKRHDDESVDDIAEMQKGRKKYDERDEKKQRDKMRREHQRLEQSLDDCARCIESKKIAKQCIVAIGINTYLAVVEWDGLDEEHLVIVPAAHAASSVQLDENVWDEMRLWRKGLTAMWKERDMDCVFFETARNVKANPHCFVECVPIPSELGETMPIYFHKAINECESEWEQDNKKLIEIKNLRKQIPRGFDYFAVDFGLQNGYAHVIEDRSNFPNTFAHEIIAGMLDLDHKRWRKREKLDFEQQKKRCDSMKEKWEPFDWTKRIKRDEGEEK